jgi:hypothetical protein
MNWKDISGKTVETLVTEIKHRKQKQIKIAGGEYES